MSSEFQLFLRFSTVEYPTCFFRCFFAGNLIKWAIASLVSRFDRLLSENPLSRARVLLFFSHEKRMNEALAFPARPGWRVSHFDLMILSSRVSHVCGPTGRWKAKRGEIKISLDCRRGDIPGWKRRNTSWTYNVLAGSGQQKEVIYPLPIHMR